MGVKSLAAHQVFFLTVNRFLKTAFMAKIFGYLILGLLEKNNLYFHYFLIKVVVIKAQ